MEEKDDNEEFVLKVKDCKYLKLDSSTDESIIKSAERVICSKDLIYIVDRKKNVIVAYDSDGKFISSSSRYVGRAANEYISILDAAYDEESALFYAYADNPSQIMIFDKYLSLQNVMSTEQLIKEIAIDKNYIYVLFYDISDYNDIKVQLRSYKKGDMANYNVLLEQKNIIHGIGSIGKCLSGYGDFCFLSMPFDNHIYKIRDGQIDNAWEIDFKGKWFDFSSSQKLQPVDFMKQNKDNIRSIFNICSTDSLLLFNTNIHKYYVLNQSTNEGYIYQNMHINDVSFSSPLLTSASGSKGVFVQLISPQTIIDYVRICDKKGVAYGNEKLQQLYKSFNEDDNPLLIICNLQ